MNCVASSNFSHVLVGTSQVGPPERLACLLRGHALKLQMMAMYMLTTMRKEMMM